MKALVKPTLIILLLCNMYFFSFFLWYRPISPIRFIDTLSRLEPGPKAVTIFLPRSEDVETPAGAISRMISFSFKPLTWFWEKRGVGMFFVDTFHYLGHVHAEVGNEQL